MIRCLKAAAPRWCVGITGGEPFAFPGFADICKKLADNDIVLWINTNLSLDAQVRRFADIVPPAMVDFLYIALHIKERSQRGGLDRFLTLCNLLRSRGFPFEVNYVLHPSLVERFADDCKRFADKGIDLKAKPFQGVAGLKLYPESYTKAEKAILLSSDPLAFKRSLFFSKDLRCHAGKSLVNICGDGVITRCVADRTRLGSLDSNITLTTEPKPCTATYCPCFGWDLIDSASVKERLKTDLADSRASLYQVRRYAGFMKRRITKAITGR